MHKNEDPENHQAHRTAWHSLALSGLGWTYERAMQTDCLRRAILYRVKQHQPARITHNTGATHP